ncbi:transmembrane protein 135-like [Amblyomma americanum]
MSLSKFWCARVPYNCYEIGHTWTPHCSQAWIDVWYNTFTRALRLYGVLYLVGQLVARRHGSRAFAQTFWSAFDSSMFISQNFFLYLTMVCVSRRLSGRLHLMQSTLLCGFVSSACAITFERPARRSVLALYMLNLASEIIYRMLRSRGIVRDVPNFEVAMFAFSLGGYIYYARKNGHFNDIVPLVLRHLIGKEELVGYDQLEAKLALKEAELLKAPCEVDKLVRMCDVTPITETSPLIACNGNGPAYGHRANKVKDVSAVANGVNKSGDQPCSKVSLCHGSCLYGSAMEIPNSVLRLLWERHCTCRHQHGCLANFCKVLLKFGSVGWSAGVGFSLLKGYRRIRIRQSLSKVLLGSTALRTGCFLGGLTGLYSLSSCLLRWLSGGQRDWHALVAGTVGGLACAACPSSYVSLYLLWKLVELVYLKSAERQLVPKFKGAAVWLYAVCTSIMLYVAILEPHNLRPQYRKFLDDISGKLLSQINRFPLDMLGLHSSQAFPHFFPLNLDRRHVSKQFLEQVLIWA